MTEDTAADEKLEFCQDWCWIRCSCQTSTQEVFIQVLTLSKFHGE